MALNPDKPVRFGRLLKCLASLGLGCTLMSAASAQVGSDGSAVSYTVSPFIEFEFLDSPGTSIEVIAHDAGLSNEYIGTRQWRIRANRGWKFVGNHFSGWTPALPENWDHFFFGNPNNSLVGGTFFGTLTFKVFRTGGPVQLLSPGTYTGTLTITIGPNPP